MSIATSDRALAAREGVLQIVGFRLGEEHYGLDIMKVQEIILIGPITRLPEVPPYVRGLINLRGHVIPVVDLRLRFGMPEAEEHEERRIIVVNVGDKTIGVVVDSVSQVMRVSEEQVDSAPSNSVGMQQDYVTGLVKLEEDIVILLDIETLLGGQENLPDA